MSPEARVMLLAYWSSSRSTMAAKRGARSIAFSPASKSEACRICRVKPGARLPGEPISLALLAAVKAPAVPG